jgi:hypothetical protein
MAIDPGRQPSGADLRRQILGSWRLDELWQRAESGDPSADAIVAHICQLIDDPSVITVEILDVVGGAYPEPDDDVTADDHARVERILRVAADPHATNLDVSIELARVSNDRAARRLHARRSYGAAKAATAIAARRRCDARPRARSRRRPRSAATRSSARSGDSGSGPGEPSPGDVPPARSSR